MTYYWKCQYNDGASISSKDGAKYKDIDRKKLEKFVLLNMDNDKPVVVLNLTGNKKLVCRMRSAIEVASNKKKTIWIVGWHAKEYGGNFQCIHFVYPNGFIEVTDGFKENHQWQYPINFLPEEM